MALLEDFAELEDPRPRRSPHRLNRCASRRCAMAGRMIGHLVVSRGLFECSTGSPVHNELLLDDLVAFGM